jgi:glyoxylase-like metal-dependent hydrolase (beta-lactamase superfamily II)
MQADEAPPRALPVVTFAESVTLHFNGEDILVQHVPNGHTDGDSVVWFKGSNVIHLGDLYFSSATPSDAAAGDVQNVEGLRALLPSCQDVRVIPGHGEVTARNSGSVKMLETITDRVRVAEEEGSGRQGDDGRRLTKKGFRRAGGIRLRTAERFLRASSSADRARTAAAARRQLSAGQARPSRRGARDSADPGLDRELRRQWLVVPVSGPRCRLPVLK